MSDVPERIWIDPATKEPAFYGDDQYTGGHWYGAADERCTGDDVEYIRNDANAMESAGWCSLANAESIVGQQSRRIEQLQQERDALKAEVERLRATMPPIKPRGTCQGCGREYSTWKDGRIRTHLDKRKRYDCPGSRMFSVETLSTTGEQP